MAELKFTLGLDFGTNSVRTLVVDISDGDEIATCVHDFRRGRAGIITDEKDANIARQDPVDYIDGLKGSIKGALEKARKVKGFSPENIIGIGVDTTGSTPIPVDRNGQPLSFSTEFKDNINALAWLWKDHSSHAEAEEITDLAKRIHPEYLAKCGGVYSSEWFFSKLLHCLRVDPSVFKAAHSWVELADFIPGVLCGESRPENLKRSVCAAGHKAMYNKDWEGLPTKDFLKALAPALGDLRDRLYTDAYTSDTVAGLLSHEKAKDLGLEAGVPVSVGAFDAHMGGLGAGIGPGTLVKIIGTSTCDMMVVPDKEKLPDIPGLCGIVDGSILPGYFGLEAGQSAVGDIFNWFVESFTTFTDTNQPQDIHQFLTEKASSIKPGESGLLALDWNNGNRTVLVDARLTGLILGQTLNTKPEEIYRSLIEATAYGARIIINRFEEYGIKVEKVIACGGIAEKNPLLMQIYADVFERPIKVSRSSQTCALGAAMFGAVVAGKERGGYRKVEEAIEHMSGVKPEVYYPDKEKNQIYGRLFSLYQQLHDIFGTQEYSGNLHHVMKELLQIKQEKTHA